MDNRTDIFLTFLINFRHHYPVEALEKIVADVEYEAALDIFVLCWGWRSEEVKWLNKYFGRDDG